MSYHSWILSKMNKRRAEKAPPYKQMKDRDMTGITVHFKRSPLIQGSYSYYFEDIEQPSEKITMTYIANLGGRKGVTKYWTHHGYGGWIPYITFNEQEYERMKAEVERLGGTVWLRI